MSHQDDLPPDIESLDRRLSEIHFRPRASLGAEIEGRLRRGERPRRGPYLALRTRWLAGLAASLLLLTGLALYLRPAASVVVDRCCYDLDGGGIEDDGVLVVAERDARVHRLQVYEDRDHSRHSSAGDLIRLDRGGEVAMGSDSAEGLVTTRHCCIDLDGGGASDDALLVIGVPPDRVVMAAIYEEPPPARRRPGSSHDFQLR